MNVVSILPLLCLGEGHISITRGVACMAMWNGTGLYIVRGNNRTVTNFQSELRPRRQSSALFLRSTFFPHPSRVCDAEDSLSLSLSLSLSFAI